MLFSRYKKLPLVFAAAVILSSCHSRKLTVRNSNPPFTNNKDINFTIPKREPYVMVKPGRDIAEKYAAELGVKFKDIQNGRLYSFIDEWLGAPYRFGGMGKDGVDCSGLVFLLQLQVYDQPVPRTCALQVICIKRKYEEELKEGDLVFFDFNGKEFSHVGVYLQNGYIVHASTSKGVIIAKLHDQGMYKYFSRAGSINDLSPAAQDN